MKVYEDKFYKLDEYILDDDSDIFEEIIKRRQNIADKDRFFLKFVPKEIMERYDLSNPDSVENFRNICYTIDSPLILMGGYNMSQKQLTDDIRYAGIKLSDPYGKIYGTFDIRNGIITYSPLFAHFSEERDVVKFAHDEYFTTATFEEIMLRQIEKAKECRLHIGNYSSLNDIMKYGNYVLENISKEQMINFLTNREEGVKVFTKNLNNNHK